MERLSEVGRSRPPMSSDVEGEFVCQIWPMLTGFCARWVERGAEARGRDDVKKISKRVRMLCARLRGLTTS